MEALRTKMDGLQWEVNRLDAENQKLRSQDPDGSDRVDLEAEWKQAQDDVGGLTEQLKNCQQRVTHSEREVTEAQERAAEAQQQAAIDLQRATEAEQQCQKAEQRLTSLEQETQQLQEAHHHMSEELDGGHEMGATSESVVAVSVAGASTPRVPITVSESVATISLAPTAHVPATVSTTSAITSAPIPTATSVSVTQPPTPLTVVAAPAGLPLVSPASSATSTLPISGATVPGSPVTPPSPSPTAYIASSNPLLAQLPQIPRYSGEEATDEEAFLDWHEQFESVALLGGWTDHGKLVNLTTRLRGAAYSFYRSCPTDKRSSYPLLVAELQKRFTPVQLTAIQTQLAC